MNPIKIIGWTAVIYTSALYLSFAQTNGSTNVSTLQPSDKINLQMLEFETNVSEFQTNEPSMASNDKMMMAIQRLKDAEISLEYNYASASRKQRTMGWFEILAAIDRHFDPNFLATNPPISISGLWPPGYKGNLKIGISGILPPDTNDIVAYSNYLAIVKSERERRRKYNLQYELQRVNQKAAPDVEGLLRSYSSSEADKQEFEELLKQSSLSDTRKQQLQDYFNKVH